MTTPSPADDYRRIAQAISYLADHFREQPSLTEIAKQIHLSPGHFQRLFKRWAGVSPKRFCQFLTLQYAKSCLDDSESLLEAAYQAGLSGPSRLHDLFVTTEAVTPGDFRRRGQGLTIGYGVHPTPFGSALLGVTDRGLCSLEFFDFRPQTSPGRQPKRSNPLEDHPDQDQLNQDNLDWELSNGDDSAGVLKRFLNALQDRWPLARLSANQQMTADLVDRLFSEPLGHQACGCTGPVTLHLKGTNFQLQVWQALLKIPAGRLWSYQQLATAVGRPTSSRAVGSAVACNPIGYVIPCHRVLRATGAISGYRWGPIRKRAMIAWEASQPQLTNRGSQNDFS